MTDNKSTIHIFFGSLAVLVAMMFFNEQAFGAIAPSQDINCETSFGEKSFTISASKIAFHEDSKLNARRSISSISAISKVRTHKTLNGFTKVLYKNGNKHKIHISNLKGFSEADDYLTIISPKGHKMTYPLTCSNI